MKLLTNFKSITYKKIKYLLNDIYNIWHVSEYFKYLYENLENILMKNKKRKFSNKKEINNEFIRNEHLDIFFRKYSFLLWLIDLRKYLYVNLK